MQFFKGWDKIIPFLPPPTRFSGRKFSLSIRLLSALFLFKPHGINAVSTTLKHRFGTPPFFFVEFPKSVDAGTGRQ
jgi:hypothetical protein